MAGSMVKHPDGDSDTEFTASTDQQVDLAGIKQLSSWVDANVLWTGGLDDENLLRGDVFDGTYKVGERDGDGGKFEGCGGVCIENDAEEGRQLGRVPLDQRGDVNDTSGRGISRKFDRFSGVLAVDIETERGQNVLDDGEVRASAGVEHDVEGFETRNLEPVPRRSKGSGGGGVHSNGPGIDIELDGECLDLGLGRNGVEGRATQRPDNLNSSTSDTYNTLSTYMYEIGKENLRERAS